MWKKPKNFVEMQNSIFIILQQSATVESVLHFWKVANLVVTTLEFQKVQHARNSSCWCKSLKWWHRGLEMEISQQNVRGQSLVYWKTVKSMKTNYCNFSRIVLIFLYNPSVQVVLGLSANFEIFKPLLRWLIGREREGGLCQS